MANKQKFDRDFTVNLTLKINEEVMKSDVIVKISRDNASNAADSEDKPDEYVQCWKTGIMYHVSELPPHLSQETTKTSPH